MTYDANTRANVAPPLEKKGVFLNVLTKVIDKN
jgi:hypothetical protein